MHTYAKSNGISLIQHEVDLIVNIKDFIVSKYLLVANNLAHQLHNVWFAIRLKIISQNFHVGDHYAPSKGYNIQLSSHITSKYKGKQ